MVRKIFSYVINIDIIRGKKAMISTGTGSLPSHTNMEVFKAKLHAWVNFE